MTPSALTQIAIEAAMEAGALLRQGFGSAAYRIDTKEGKHNLVTEYDLLAQKTIIAKIAKTFPTHHFLAEEDEVSGSPSDEILWIIDPLDGTVNFAHRIPFFAVSIAAARQTDILSGVVYNPITHELFVAEKGKGAHLNGKPIHVTHVNIKEQAFCATGFPYNVDENPLRCIDRLKAMLSLGLPIRRLGVASLDLAYVAAGRFDLFWEVGLHTWDMAAGKLLIEEAGGKVTCYDGTPHPIYGYLPLLATNGHLHADMVKLFKEDLR